MKPHSLRAVTRNMLTVHAAVVHASHAPAEMLAAFATLVDCFFRLKNCERSCQQRQRRQSTNTNPHRKNGTCRLPLLRKGQTMRCGRTEQRCSQHELQGRQTPAGATRNHLNVLPQATRPTRRPSIVTCIHTRISIRIGHMEHDRIMQADEPAEAPKCHAGRR